MSLSPGEPDVPHAPAPWELHGEAFILLCSFPRTLKADRGLVPGALEACFQGGTGAVMFIDYQRSNVGPYQELLVVPGTFQLGGQTAYAVTRIWVSSRASVVNGRRNWGVPKELAEFALTRPAPEQRRFRVTQEGALLADVTLQPRGWHVPFSTVVVPPHARTLLQVLDGQLFRTVPAGTGRLGKAQVVSARFDAARLGPLETLPVLGAVHAQPFTLHFPAASVTPFSAP